MNHTVDALIKLYSKYQYWISAFSIEKSPSGSLLYNLYLYRSAKKQSNQDHIDLVLKCTEDVETCMAELHSLSTEEIQIELNKSLPYTITDINGKTIFSAIDELSLLSIQDDIIHLQHYCLKLWENENDSVFKNKKSSNNSNITGDGSDEDYLTGEYRWNID